MVGRVEGCRGEDQEGEVGSRRLLVVRDGGGWLEGKGEIVGGDEGF